MKSIIKGGKKSGAGGLMSTPCTIAEATQIARGVAEDVLSDYSHSQSPLYVAMSLQIEILKDLVIKSGIISEDEFRNLYMQKAEDFNQRQREMYERTRQEIVDQLEGNAAMDPKMGVSVSDIEVQKTEGESSEN